MKKKGLWFLGIVVVLLAGGGLTYRAIAKNQAAETSAVQTATVQSGRLTATLGASGNTRSAQNATISWQTSGKVGEVSLRPGDPVQEDQVLATLDPNTLSTEMIKAKQDLIEAQQYLDDLLNSKLQQAQALQAVVDAQESLDSLKQKAAEAASQAQLTLAEAQETLKDAKTSRLVMNYPHSSDELVIEKAYTDYMLAKKAYTEAVNKFNKVDQKRTTNPERVLALNNLVSAKQAMEKALSTYNWYLLGYTESEIAQADAALAVAQANLEAAQSQWDLLKGGASKAAIALAEATLADAQREYERVKDGPRADDVAAAQAAVDAAQAVLNHAQLLAPFAGTITEVKVNSGDLVSAGDTAFRIDDLASIYIDLQISEVDLASLAVGQQAVVEFDAIADKEYSGEVTEIGMIGSISSGVVTYPVTVRLTSVDEAIRTGMTASVTIIVDQVENALLVPNRAIRTSSGQKTVTVLFEGLQISVPVTTGLIGDSQSEVISGQLREGDVVVISGSNSSSNSASTIQNRTGFGGPEGIIIGPGGMP
ncbi:MAG TPA: efflux RND transporter periplasmic adaptor subunit [Anaerolineales bacterium]|nr:efflux RND transporter periplasmic adaptor subunit [Anaerolineales bacterium]